MADRPNTAPPVRAAPAGSSVYGGSSMHGGGGKPIGERVSRIEWEQESIRERLNAGAETFSEMTQSQKELHEQIREARKPVPTPWWKIVGLMVGVLSMILVWVWYAAKYPNRDEFNNARQQNTERAKTLERGLQQLKLEQVQIKSDVRSIKDSQSRTEKHVDEIKKDIKAMARPRRRRR